MFSLLTALSLVNTAAAQSFWTPTCCTIALPDLVAWDIAAPAGAYPGEDIAYYLEGYFSNDGAADAAEFASAWFLSTDTTFDASDSLLIGGRDFYTGLAAGAWSSTPAYTSIEVPSAMSPGSYYLLLVVDELGHIYEWSETNNVVAVPFTVY